MGIRLEPGSKYFLVIRSCGPTLQLHVPPVEDALGGPWDPKFYDGRPVAPLEAVKAKRAFIKERGLPKKPYRAPVRASKPEKPVVTVRRVRALFAEPSTPSAADQTRSSKDRG